MTNKPKLSSSSNSSQKLKKALAQKQKFFKEKKPNFKRIAAT